MTARQATVGVLGSLCNPPHLGHLLLASEAAWQLGLDKVLLVPTGIPPHRDPPRESPELRTRLAAALVTCDPVLELCRIEADKQEPAYTADTLEELAASGVGELVLLLGADQLAALHTWHDPERVRAAARIAVAPRPARRSAATPTWCGCPRSRSRRRRSPPRRRRRADPPPRAGSGARDRGGGAAVPSRRRGSLTSDAFSRPEMEI